MTPVEAGGNVLLPYWSLIHYKLLVDGGMKYGERPIHHKSTPTLLGRQTVLAVLSVIFLLLSFCDPPFLIPLFQPLIEHKDTRPQHRWRHLCTNLTTPVCTQLVLKVLFLEIFAKMTVRFNFITPFFVFPYCKVSIKVLWKQTKKFFQISFQHECHKLNLESVNEWNIYQHLHSEWMTLKRRHAR